MLKRILLAPALWLEKYAIRDGQFTGRAKRTAKVVTGVSIVTLVADPLLSMARFGEFGLSHPLYYVVMAALILMIYLIMRPGAETSLREMRRSQNWFVKGIFFSLFGALLAIEWLVVKAQGLSGEKKRQYRLDHSKPVVSDFFQWCRDQLAQAGRVPSDPLTKALNYVLSREASLTVFLENPNVQPDTNHLERALRPIPMGKKNWMFCWTELGAEHLGLIQSLISTCKLHDVNPYTYLVDVLQRVSRHPVRAVADLTPRIWKTRFAENPLRALIDPRHPARQDTPLEISVHAY